MHSSLGIIREYFQYAGLEDTQILFIFLQKLLQKLL